MKPNPFLNFILDFYRNNVILSFLIVASLALFIVAGEKFYTVVFFLFVLFLSGSLKNRRFTAAHMLLVMVAGALAGMALYYLWLGGLFLGGIVNVSVALQAAIISFLFAVAAYNPDVKLNIMFTTIWLKFAAPILLILHLLSLSLPQVYLAHLGAMLAGLAFGFSLKTTHRAYWQVYFRQVRALFRRKPRMKAEKGTKRPETDDAYNARRAERQAKVDAILDKISKSGYESLTKEEKELLFSVSGKNQ